METVQQSIFLPYRDGELHLRKISPAAGFRHQIPILMLHGAMSNGRVFYSSRGRGLAPFLAQAGFTVYVMDSAGRGLSTPKLARGFELGQARSSVNNCPGASVSARGRISGQAALVCPFLGRGADGQRLGPISGTASSVASLLTFGSKRTIRVRSLKKWLMVDLVWNRLAPGIAAGHGYLAADKWRMGMDNESRASLQQSIDWVRGDWIDHDDGFDYGLAAAKATWPKIGLSPDRMTLCSATRKMCWI